MLKKQRFSQHIMQTTQLNIVFATKSAKANTKSDTRRTAMHVAIAIRSEANSTTSQLLPEIKICKSWAAVMASAS